MDAPGKEHKHSDFYSSENPIPSIQRFVKQGFSKVIAKKGDSSDEYDSGEDESGEEGQDGGEGEGASSRPSAEDGGRFSQQSSRKEKLGGLLRRRRKGKSSSQQDRNEDEKEGHDDDEEANKAPEERAQERQQGKYRKQKRGKATTVQDPITSQEICVRDVRKRDYERAIGREDGRREGKDPHGDDHHRPMNLTSAPFPPAQEMAGLREVHPWLLPLWFAWCLSLIVWSRSLTAIVFGLGNAWIGWWAFRHIKIGIDERRWERERQRGQAATVASLNSYGESKEPSTDVAGAEGNMEGAEWLNGVMRGLWEVMDPAIFEAAAGTLEDVMQASAPAFIHQIKVVDLNHGLTPIRVAGVKAEYVQPSKTDSGDGDGDASSGKHINLQMSVIYSAAKTDPTVTSHSRNARLLIHFYLGLRKVVSIPLPVWVEIKGFVGTVRARVQLSPEAPFIKNLTVTFLGLPRVRVEVLPLKVNLADIPILSGFVQSSIEAALAEYCAPSSLTLDVGEILMGDSVKREVNALGVIVVWIHRAYDLEKQDRRGSSDPYVTVSYSRLGKVLYATRVALNDLNPRWEECHIMLVTPEAVRAKEKISLALYDSDLLTQDDILGRVEFDIAPLICRPGHKYRRSDTLMGLRNDQTKKGQLETTVAFYKKSANTVEASGDTKQSKRDSEKSAGGEEAEGNGREKSSLGSSTPPPKERHNDRTADADPFESINEKTSTRELLQMLDAAESSRQTRNQQTSVQFSPPRQDIPSGILSVQVHQIEDLGLRNAGAQKGKGLARSQSGSAAQQIDDVDDQSEESEDAPSPYVSIILNDQTIMISRVKALTKAPFFNIGTERFLRDWRRSYVMIAVRDRRLREDDALLGVVPIKLSTLFSEHGTSQVTQHFPMAGGIGYGRVRISVLFRPLENMDLDNSKLGFDIGTMRVHSSPRAVDLKEPNLLKFCSLRMRTLAGQKKLSSRHQHSSGENGELEWRVKPEDLWLRIPARRRYSAPFLFEFRRPNAVGKKSLVAASLVWMQDVDDDVRWLAKLPIYKGSPDLHRFLQNYHDYRDESEACSLGVERIGTLEVELQFKSGIGLVHAKLDGNEDSRRVMQAWNACVAAGLRSENGDFVEGGKEEEGDGEEERAETEAEATEESEGESDVDETVGHDGAARYNRHHESQPDGESHRDEDDSDRDSQDDDDDEDTKPASNGDNKKPLSAKFRDWRAEMRELDRQHRGLRSHKTVRSLDWAAGGVKRAASKAKKGLSVQERAPQVVDSEMAG